MGIQVTGGSGVPHLPSSPAPRPEVFMCLVNKNWWGTGPEVFFLGGEK